MAGVVTRFAGGGSAASGSVDGTGSAALFSNPVGIAVGTSGTVYVADLSNHIVRMISPTGTIIAHFVDKTQFTESANFIFIYQVW